MVSFQRITLSFLLVSGALFAYLIPRCPSHFRDYGHACQQCASSRCFRHARPCLHTYDTALCTGHEQQPERSNGQREETPRMVNIQPTVIEGIWKGYLLFLDCLLSTYLPKNNCFNLDLYYQNFNWRYKPLLEKKNKIVLNDCRLI